jgi:hypothetical protein
VEEEELVTIITTETARQELTRVGKRGVWMRMAILARTGPFLRAALV